MTVLQHNYGRKNAPAQASHFVNATTSGTVVPGFPARAQRAFRRGWTLAINQSTRKAGHRDGCGCLPRVRFR
jgi:hypothetical protein